MEQKNYINLKHPKTEKHQYRFMANSIIQQTIKPTAIIPEYFQKPHKYTLLDFPNKIIIINLTY
jgi:hypothetical protein